MEGIVIKNLILGSVGTNCILVMNQDVKELVIVDPGDEVARIIKAIEESGCKPAGIFLTHGHFDHILAVDALRSRYGILVYAQEEEQDILENPTLNLSGSVLQVCSIKADILLRDRQVLEVAGMKFTVFHTPGHTKGCCCYYLPQAKALLSGDTLFAGSVGRMDLPTASGAQMKSSIHVLMRELPEDVKVYPGHGEATTIGHEKRFNPFA